MPDIETPDFEGSFEEYASLFIEPLERAMLLPKGERHIDVDNLLGRDGTVAALNRHFAGRAIVTYGYCGPAHEGEEVFCDTHDSHLYIEVIDAKKDA